MNPAERADLIATMRNHGICIVVATYNNAATLEHVLDDILGYADDVIVVNDGCTDGSQAILDRLAERITAVTHRHNKGKGAALKSGFRKARELGFGYAITIDSDGQHYASDIPRLVRAVVENPDALIIGERDLRGADMKTGSSFANKFSNFWFALQTGHRLRDTQTGLRAYPLNRLAELRLMTNRYEAELTLLVFAAWHGVKLVQVPVSVYYPPREERVSHFKPVSDFARISVLNTLLCLLAVVYGLPVRFCSAIAGRRFFTGEFRMFTRRKGKPKEAAVTFGRLARSLHGIMFFVVNTTLVFTPFVALFFALGKNTEHKKLRFHKMLQGISRFLIRNFPGAKTCVDNAAGETFDTPALIICNHQSHLDLPMLMALHPKMVFLTNDWVWNNPFYGVIIHKAEFLPVSGGLDPVMPHLRDLVARGYSIVVFPEGTRSPDCSILRFHQGAFMLAHELGLDILPMTLHGAGHYLPKNDFMLRRGKISLRVHERVPQKELEGIDLRRQASRFRHLSAERHAALADETETAEYFHSAVFYRYAWRGWNNVARCKKTLRQSRNFDGIINRRNEHRRVRIINSGIGTFALLYALVNRYSEIYAFEEDSADYQTANATAALPPNLHFVPAAKQSDYDCGHFDLTIVLRGHNPWTNGTATFIPIES